MGDKVKESKTVRKATEAGRTKKSKGDEGSKLIKVAVEYPVFTGGPNDFTPETHIAIPPRTACGLRLNDVDIDRGYGVSAWRMASLSDDPNVITCLVCKTGQEEVA